MKGRPFQIETYAARKHLANWDVLHIDTSNSNGWAPGAVGVCRTQEENIWKLNEQSMIRVRINLLSHIRSSKHDVDDTITRNSDQGIDWPPNTPAAQEVEGDSQQLTPTPENNTWGLREQMHNKPTTKYPFAARHGTQYRMVFEGELDVKLYAKDFEVRSTSPSLQKPCFFRIWCDAPVIAPLLNPM